MENGSGQLGWRFLRDQERRKMENGSGRLGWRGLRDQERRKNGK